MSHAFPLAMMGALLIVFVTLMSRTPITFVGTPDDFRRFRFGMVMIRLIGYFMVFSAGALAAA